MQSKLDEQERQLLLSKNQLDQNEAETKKLKEDFDSLKVSNQQEIQKLTENHKKEVNSYKMKETDLNKVIQSKD